VPSSPTAAACGAGSRAAQTQAALAALTAPAELVFHCSVCGCKVAEILGCHVAIRAPNRAEYIGASGCHREAEPTWAWPDGKWRVLPPPKPAISQEEG
jgi:hypothetical protein